MTECKNQSKNQKRCNCTYEPCSRKGNCCECLQFHLAMKELPACCFNRTGEASYDRSFECFAKFHI